MAYPIYPGMDVKIQVETFFDDFRLTDDSFRIVIRDAYGRIVRTVEKDDCFWDADGRYYFTMEKVKKGVYYAFFDGSYEDEDYDSQLAGITDWQKMLEVPSPALADGCKKQYIRDGQCLCRHRVRYTVVTTVSIDGDEYLCGSDGKYILTSDGKRICFKNDKREKVENMGKVYLETMTGDEFKQLIEGENPNGKIDTIPEQMRAMQGISDDSTVKEEIQEEVSESDVERVTPEDLAEFEV